MNEKNRKIEFIFLNYNLILKTDKLDAETIFISRYAIQRYRKFNI